MIIENIIFSGGGCKGLVHLGIINYLEQNNLLYTINNYVGVSIGALFALLLAIGLKTEEIYKFLLLDNIPELYKNLGIFDLYYKFSFMNMINYCVDIFFNPIHSTNCSV